MKLAADGRQRLATFKTRVKADKYCAFWSSVDNLTYELARGVRYQQQQKPDAGWIRKMSLPEEAFLRTSRGVSLLESMIDSGIDEVELWKISRNRLPPESFFELSRSEIVISAATAYGTLNEYGALLKHRASHGIGVRFLLLHPALGATELHRWSQHEENRFKDMLDESRRTLSLVVARKYHRVFEFRFRKRLAPFTAIMTDSDVDAIDDPNDEGGRLRIHPCTSHSFGEKGGLMIQLSKREAGPTAFDYYATDLRRQWAWEGKHDPDLFAPQHSTAV